MQLPMLRILRHQLRLLRHLKILEIKSRSDRAPHDGKRLPIRHVRSKPASRPHHGLQNLSRLRIIPQLDRRILPPSGSITCTIRAARIEVPHLVRPQPVKRRKVLPLQQKVNRRRSCPCPRESRRQRLPRNHHIRPIRLPKIPALRMRPPAVAAQSNTGVLIQVLLPSAKRFRPAPHYSD